jgi:beta-N-acetylhexosaminidase
VVVSLHGLTTNSRRNYGIQQEDLDLINKLNAHSRVVLVVYGIPYSLSEFPEIGNLVCSYEDNSFSRSVVSQLLFGAIPFRGVLPVSVDSRMPAGHGIMTRSMGRLGFSTPESEGLSSNYLASDRSADHGGHPG